MFKLTFTPEFKHDGYRTEGPTRMITSGSLDECIAAWSLFVAGNRYGVNDATTYPVFGLLHSKGVRFSLHIGGAGSLSIALAPDLVANPVYEVRPAAERDQWVAAGDTMESAEVQMRQMGDGPSRLLILRNNATNELSVWDANGLGYLDFKGTYEAFYGV